MSHEALRHSASLWLTLSLTPQAASTAAADRTSTGTASAAASNGPARRARPRTPAPAGPNIPLVSRIVGPGRAAESPCGAHCDEGKPDRANAGTGEGFGRGEPPVRLFRRRMRLPCFANIPAFPSSGRPAACSLLLIWEFGALSSSAYRKAVATAPMLFRTASMRVRGFGALSMAAENCAFLAIEKFSLLAPGRFPRRGVWGLGLDGAAGNRVGAATAKSLAETIRLSMAGGRHTHEIGSADIAVLTMC